MLLDPLLPPERFKGSQEEPGGCLLITATSSCDLTRHVWTQPSPKAIMIFAVYIEQWVHLSVLDDCFLYFRLL